MAIKSMLILILLALVVCVTNATRPAPVKEPFLVNDCVYCDTCKAGFENDKTTRIPGAKVKVECRDRDTLLVVFSVETLTDSKGEYEVSVAFDHGEQICDAVLVTSPQRDCATVTPGCERARVILTNNNGIRTNKRYANNLGFIKDEAEEGCTELLKSYKLKLEEEV